MGDIGEAGVTQLQLSQDAAEGKSALDKELGGKARLPPHHGCTGLETTVQNLSSCNPACC